MCKGSLEDMIEFAFGRILMTQNFGIFAKRTELSIHSDLSRLDIVTQKDEERTEKYRKAIELLENSV